MAAASAVSGTGGGKSGAGRFVTLAFLGVALSAAACGAPAEREDEEGPGTRRSADPVRTGDPAERGLDRDDFPRVHELSEDVYAYAQLRSAGGEWFTTVSLFVVSEEGVLVADGQGSVEETRRLVETIREYTDRPITHVVIGSDHGDHTAGNSAFPDDVVVLAHPTSERALRRRANDPERSADAPPVLFPTQRVEEREVVRLGRREIEVLFLGRAHTGGDLVVHLPRERILFMSETFMNRIFPAMRAAYPSEWVEMLERAQAMEVDLYVPGHGFVDSPEVLREELDRYRRALIQVIEEVERLHDEGSSVEEAVRRAEFGDLEGWTLRSSQGPIAVRRVYDELEGRLR